MPLSEGAEELIRQQFTRLAAGERVPLIAIGSFTTQQFLAINVGRVQHDLHELAQNEIVFIGKHLYISRTQDGYSIDDIVAQIVSAICEDAVASIERFVSRTQNSVARDDGYGNMVHDLAVFEMTAKKPRAELFSVIPKGDANKPKKEKGC
jgi:hypothetical protein